MAPVRQRGAPPGQRADLQTWIDRLAPDERRRPGGTPRVRKGSHPRWIVTAVGDALGGGPGNPDLEAALEADDKPPAVHLVARPGRIDRAELVALSGGPPGGLLAYGVYLHGGDPGALRPVGGGSRRRPGRGVRQLVASR